MLPITDETLRGMPLDLLRDLAEQAQRVVFDRRCHSTLFNVGPCSAEPPHADGWHECESTYGNTASPAYSSMSERVRVRWRFADDVVEREHAHEAGRRPGAN